MQHRTALIATLCVGAASMAVAAPTHVFLNSTFGIYSVEIATGVRTPLPNAGATVSMPHALRAESPTTLLGTGNNTTSVFRVDRTTGSKTLLSTSSIGSGPTFSEPTDLVIDPSGDVYLYDDDQQRILHVDLPSGDRTSIVQQSIGDPPGTTLDNVFCLERLSTGHLFAIGATSALRIDPVAGTKVAWASTAFTPGYFGVEGGTLLDDSTAVVVHGETFVSTYTAGGTTTTIASNSIGSGPLFQFLRDAALGDDGMLYVYDSGSRSIFRVNPANGDRTTVSSDTLGVGSGPNLVGANPCYVTLGYGTASVGGWQDY